MLWLTADISMDLMQKKVSDAKQSGADYLCAACPYCQVQFDRVQKMSSEKKGTNRNIPSILYTQLLGLTLGIDEKTLGLDQNELGVDGITELL